MQPGLRKSILFSENFYVVNNLLHRNLLVILKTNFTKDKKDIDKKNNRVYLFISLCS